MSTKRKSVLPAEPSPEVKRRQSTGATPKKREREEGSDDEKPVKVRISKKKLALAALASTSSTTVPLEGGVKRGRPKKIAVSAKFEAVSTVNETRPQTPILKRPSVALPLETKSGLKESADIFSPTKATKSPAVRRKSTTTTPKKVDVAQKTIQTPKTAPKPPVVETKSIVHPKVHAPNVQIVLSALDEEEVLFWDQLWNSTAICIALILPIFLGLILFCHFASVVFESQGIASVGITFCMVLFGIVTAFIVSVFPLTLFSKLFTDFVNSSFDYRARWAFKRNLNLYTTFQAIILMILMVGVSYFYSL